MASQPDSKTEIDKTLFAVATKVARDKSRLHKAQIAERAGMTPRMLNRLSTGRTRASEDQRERILLACNLPTMTSRLLAEINQADLIGTGSHEWIDGFIGTIIPYLALIKAESGMDVDGRWAGSDAALLVARWQKCFERRQTFLNEYF